MIALSKVDGDMTLLSSPIGRAASAVLAVVCYLSVGPLFAVPRTATVSFTIGVAPFLGGGASGQALLIYSILYFAFVALVSLYPARLLDVLGNVLSPLKLLALAALGVAAFLYPAGPAGAVADVYAHAPFAQGFSDGYLTMDTLGALVFGIVIVNAIRSRGVTDRGRVMGYAAIAGIMALVGFVLIYIGLFKLGNNSAGIAASAENGADVLHLYVRHTFGVNGDVFLAALIMLACAVTAIGLTTACATYFSALCRVPYKPMVFGLALFGFAMSNFGLTKIISISAFALTAIYPPCIVLVLLSFLRPWLRRPSLVFSAVMLTSLLFGLLDALKTLKLPALSWYADLPLAESGLVWLMPALAVFVASVALDRFLAKTKAA